MDISALFQNDETRYFFIDYSDPLRPEATEVGVVLIPDEIPFAIVHTIGDEDDCFYVCKQHLKRFQ